MNKPVLPFRPSILVLALAAAVSPAQADILNVTGDCTLTSAITNANADADMDGPDGCPAGSGADVINLESNSYRSASAVNNITNGPNGFPSVTSDIILNGNGSMVFRSLGSSTPKFRIFHVGKTGKLSINQLSIVNGHTNGEGGGIYNKGVLTLTDSTVSGNSAAIDGGGIDNTYTGTLTLVNSRISNNTASFSNTRGMYGGGGIFNNGFASLIHTTVSGNTSGFCHGGGIRNFSGRLYLTNSTVSKNTVFATSSGGITSDHSSFLSLVNSTVSNNTVGLKAGIILDPLGYGGGIVNGRGSTAVLTNSKVSGNRAANQSGGIHNGGGYLQMYNSTVSDNTVSGNSASPSQNGGGIFNTPIPAIFGGYYQGKVNLINSTVSGNTAKNGAGIRNLGELKLADSTLSGNTAALTGGGLSNAYFDANYPGIATLVNTTVSGNRSTSGQGGGVYGNTGSSLTLTNSLIANSVGGDCQGPATLSGNNGIEDGSCGATLQGDPKLGPLLDNGGASTTHALLPGSLALNAADSSLCSVSDQRSALRPNSSSNPCDLGGYEKIALTPEVRVLVSYFNGEVSAGTLLGTGPQALTKHQINAVRNQLLTAGNYKHSNRQGLACRQLGKTLRRIDVDSDQDANDYVTGPGASSFSDKLKQQLVDWGCRTES